MASDPLRETARAFLARKRAAKAAGKYCREYRRQYETRPAIPPLEINGTPPPWGRGERGELCRDSFDGWRVVGDAHEVIRLDYTGWYMDVDRFSLAVGVVVQLPARTRGVPRYFPAVRYTDSDGVTIFTREETDDKDTAARWADQNAERIAERERDYQEAWREKEDARELIEEARERLDTARATVRAAAREAGAVSRAARWAFLPCASPVVLALHAAMRDARETARAAVEVIRKQSETVERLAHIG